MDNNTNLPIGEILKNYENYNIFSRTLSDYQNTQEELMEFQEKFIQENFPIGSLVELNGHFDTSRYVLDGVCGKIKNYKLNYQSGFYELVIECQVDQLYKGQIRTYGIPIFSSQVKKWKDVEVK